LLSILPSLNKRCQKKAILECLIGYTPVGCAYGIGSFIGTAAGGGSAGGIIWSGIGAALGCIKDATWSECYCILL
jgi:hypothetical protein